VQGEEVPTPIDTGTFTITNTRAVFVGAKATREWAWGKVLGVTHSDDPPWTAIAVSNRQKTSGVLYDKDHAEMVRFWIDLALGRATGSAGHLIADLQSEIAQLEMPDQSPQLPGPAST
jgi:hypothetical protein